MFIVFKEGPIKKDLQENINMRQSKDCSLYWNSCCSFGSCEVAATLKSS